jgi:hypothetical protein
MIQTEQKFRALTVSDQEIHGLIKFHVSMARRLANATGKIVLKQSAGVISLNSAREIRTVIEEAKKLSEYHVNRAKGLHSILKS